MLHAICRHAAILLLFDYAIADISFSADVAAVIFLATMLFDAAVDTLLAAAAAAVCRHACC